MKRLRKFLTILITIAFLTPSTFSFATSYESLNGTSPETYEDILFLKETLKDKKIVGVGEATHGTHDFFQFKDKLFRFLVKELNFKAFAIEMTMNECNKINDYVLNGTGNPRNIISSEFYQVFANEELLSLVEWMREYNKTAKESDKVRFYGFDVQDTADESYNFDLYFTKIESKTYKEISLLPKRDSIYYGKLLDDLQTNKALYISKSSEKEFTLIEKLVKNRQLSLGMDLNTRDNEMANNIKWIKDYEEKHYNNSKIMLWAHNFHVSKAEPYDTMGMYLHEIFKGEYYAIGTDFYSGNFTAGRASDGASGYYISKTSGNHFSAKVNELFPEENFLYFDIKSSLEDSKLNSLFTSATNIYGLGWGKFDKYNYDKGNPNILSKSYDGMLYVKNTSESKFLNASIQPTKFNQLDKSNTNIFTLIIAASIFIIGIVACVFIFRDIRKKK